MAAPCRKHKLLQIIMEMFPFHLLPASVFDGDQAHVYYRHPAILQPGSIA